MWLAADVSDKQHLQAAVFPTGLAWNSGGFGTVVTIPAFNWLGGVSRANPPAIQPHRRKTSKRLFHKPRQTLTLPDVRGVCAEGFEVIANDLVQHAGVRRPRLVHAGGRRHGLAQRRCRATEDRAKIDGKSDDGGGAHASLVRVAPSTEH